MKNATTTFIIRGRKRALKEAYDRSLNVKYSYYCITGDELVKSYRPFIPYYIIRSSDVVVDHI